jgi:hypothetical protein
MGLIRRTIAPAIHGRAVFLPKSTVADLPLDIDAPNADRSPAPPLHP